MSCQRFLNQLLHGLLVGGPEQSGPKLPEEVLGREAGGEVVLGLETPSLGLQGHDLALESRNAVAARLFGELARLERRQVPVDRGAPMAIACATRRSSR